MSRQSFTAKIATPLGALASLAAPVIVLAGAAPERPFAAAAVSFLMVATPIAVGIYAQRRPATRRFGRQLVLLGLGLLVTTLSYADSDALYTLGRIDGWVMEIAIIYVLCAYPTGWLRGRAERLTVLAGVLLLALLFVAMVPFAEFPLPSPWTTCIDGCPANALASGHAPDLVTDLILPLRSVLATALFAATALVVARRVRSASPLARTSLSLVLGVAVTRFAAESAYVIARGAGTPDEVLMPIAIAVNLTIPLVALGFLAGLLRWRLRVARALERLSDELGPAQGVAELRAALRSCLEDPELRLYLPDPAAPGRWLDAAGNRPDPDPAPGRTLCELRDGGAPIALVHCDLAIAEQRGLLDAIGSAVGSFLERERLAGALRSTLAEVDASRTRIAAAADATRRQIERDLHDGTQQRLIALRIRIELIEAEMDANPDRAREMLAAVGPELEAAIADVRDLSRGIYPPLLADAGPAAALRGTTASLPVAVRISGEPGRLEEEVEAAVYFCCAEAIQNAIKHGRDLGEIAVSFSAEDGHAGFEVLDDGGGFGPGAPSGSGITNMRDRLAAVGGTLNVTCSQRGTSVRGVIPVPQPEGGRDESAAPAPA